MKTGLAVATLSMLLLISSRTAAAALIIDTGTPDNNAGWFLAEGQFFGGEFTLAGELTIDGIQGYFSTYAGGNLAFAIHADGGNVPGAIIYSTTASFEDVTPLDWYGASGLNWALGPGSYWISFKPDATLQGTMPGYAPNALSEYAQASGNYLWQDLGENYFEYLDIGVRIDATVGVPEPASLLIWLLLGLTIAGAGCWRSRRVGA